MIWGENMKHVISLNRKAYLGVMAALWSGAACAALPYVWEQVTLPASSGATCANGTPYRFYVNRSLQLFSKNVLVAIEPGGACWDYASCQGNGELGASNPNGIPDGYVNVIHNWAFNPSGLVVAMLSPILSRLPILALSSTWQAPPTMNWHYVYLPYCTGDIHGGNAVRVYTAPDGRSTRIQQFAGLANVKAAIEWMTQNGLSKPDQLLVWGASAGGYGSALNYASIRTALQPRKSALFDDSGTIFPANLSGDATQPSHAYRMYAKAFDEWNFLRPGGAVDRITNLPNLSTAEKNSVMNNPAELYDILARSFPNDRMGLSTFQRDEVIAQFTYDQFYPEIAAAPDAATKQALRQALFTNDLRLLTNELKGHHPNFGYFMPEDRAGLLGNHMVSALTFLGSEINGNGQNVGAFLSDLLSNQDPQHTPVMQAYSTSTDRPPIIRAIFDFVMSTLKAFGLGT
ncbi:hypothetical protein WS70_24015 [Burkholderia mayonis]|uniref:Pectinacetylesterase n=2 Tax=Burkholderia mayonis TaxID=1385591 RepID=A0A1B4FMC9_9BURK|nr:hypothetical protein WS70_24015 [Burkholderia mayonis]KVE45629.1 hypothetical protein WS70_04320 [Burkholderia mayonis]